MTGLVGRRYKQPSGQGGVVINVVGSSALLYYGGQNTYRRLEWWPVSLLEPDPFKYTKLIHELRPFDVLVDVNAIVQHAQWVKGLHAKVETVHRETGEFMVFDYLCHSVSVEVEHA